MIKEEIRIFFTALMFYTRIPCPAWVDHSDEYINKATRYFPLIGWIVAAVNALILYGAARLFNVEIAVVLSLIISVLTTGAFHEDGFADVCDGFGGGWTKEKILLIMKDSRVGAFGVIGLILLFLLKFLLLFALANAVGVKNIQLFLLLIIAHTTSRFMASTFILTHSYVRETDDSKAKPVAKSVQPINFSIAFIFVIISFAVYLTITQSYWILITLVAAWVTKLFLAGYFKKWIGGYTGDCLGATQQICEIVCYMTFLVIWKFT